MFLESDSTGFCINIYALGREFFWKSYAELKHNVFCAIKYFKIKQQKISFSWSKINLFKIDLENLF